jgi:hypothetical protein
LFGGFLWVVLGVRHKTPQTKPTLPEQFLILLNGAINVPGILN